MYLSADLWMLVLPTAMSHFLFCSTEILFYTDYSFVNEIDGGFYLLFFFSGIALSAF